MFDNVTAILKSCVCGKVHSLLTDECVVDNTAEIKMKEYIDAHGFKSPAIVSDTNTDVFTSRIEEHIKAAKIVIDGSAHATEVYAALVGEFIDKEKPDVMVACGSGSLHDITRYASFEKKIPFISYPTAASVDGFVSSIAAMTWYGQKISYESAPPIAVFASPAVFCTAPERLTASGVSDVFGKYTSLFDWEAAEILTGEYRCPGICDIEYDAVRDLKEAVLARNTLSPEEYTTKVMNALLLSGLAMQLTGNSRPASASEHHMSHLWEMHCINEDTEALHGEKVGVGLLEVVRKYNEFLSGDIDFDKIRNIDLGKVFDRDMLLPIYGELTDAIIKENLPGGVSSLSKISITDEKAVDSAIRKAAAAIPSPEELEKLLKLASAPTTAAEIDLPTDREFMEKSLRFAPYARNRLTLLKVISACEM